MTKPPSAPRVTYPHGIVRTLSPNIAWMGDAHDACEVRIGTEETAEQASVWKSGVVKSVEACLETPQLPSDKALHAFVRLRSSAGWGKWSAGARFRTPVAPVVRIESPVDAGRAKGPSVEIAWRVEADSADYSQGVSIDGGKYRSVPTAQRTFSVADLAGGVHSAAVRVTSGGRTVEDKTTFYVYEPVQQAPGKLYTLDLTSLCNVNVDDARQAAAAFDTLHAVAVLQGIVNREAAALYIEYTAVDRFWLDKIRERGGYLEHAELVPLSSVEDAITAFASRVKGAVVWDPSVPCTSNIASTIGGVEDLLPVRYDESPDSLYDRLITNGPRLRVAHNLVGMFTGAGKIPGLNTDSTGSAKCDAYLWAKAKYLDSGKCNPAEVGYWCDAFWLQQPRDMSLDNVGLTNHDFIVARKGFICDLNVWSDEAPRDDPKQRPGLDREVLQEILLSCYKANKGRMFHFTGFTPWAMKYTNVGNAGGKHDAVPTEWETAQIVSAYNGYMDADAIGYVGMANASVFAQCRLPDRLIQNPPPTREQLEARGYIDADGNVARLNFVYHYLGDYDSAAWMYNRLPEIWQNRTRGQVPSGWAFNPSLIERLPVAFEWFYETKSPRDYFVAGDSGAGYVNPTQLFPPRKPSGLPSAAQAWIDHCTRYYRQLNYSLTGFVINGFCGRLTAESNALFRSFSGDGILTQPHWMPEGNEDSHLEDGLIVAKMQQDITAPIDIVVEAILKHGIPDETRFLSFRSILVGSDWIRTVNTQIRERRPDCRYEPVDPYTWFYLLRHFRGGTNDKRATYTFDTMPSELKAGQTIRMTAGLRNDGWDTWEISGPDAVVLNAAFGSRDAGTDVSLPRDVAPGEGVVVSFTVKAPENPGVQAFRLELRRGADGWFGDAGDLPWEKQLRVR